MKELEYKNWSETTIRTLIKRLQCKGMIKIIGFTSKNFVYKANIIEKDYQKEQLQHFVDTVLRGDKNKLKILGE